jgi:60 kDa SS-A/Ro ribonucleoprotein
MARKYGAVLNAFETPQSQPIPGEDMAANNAGGFSYEITPMQRLDRFLILGSESNTFYQSKEDLSRKNAANIEAMIKADGPAVVKRIAEIVEENRAPKMGPAIFALAMCEALGNIETRHAVETVFNRVCRIGTHLFEFLDYYTGMAGHLNKQGTPTPDCNRQFLRLIARWYEMKDASALAYQVAKYQSREKWSHRDVLRLLHQKPSEAHAPIYTWITKGEWVEGTTPDKTYATIEGFEKIKRVETADAALAIIRDYKLPRECVPTAMLNDKRVWEVLLEDMPMTAMIRNLGKMSSIELLTYRSAAAKKVADELTNAEKLRRARVHPIALLSALRVYKNGEGFRGSLKWNPVSAICDALDGAFYLAFKNVEPTGKRILLALDVSGSMGGGEVAGVPGLTPREASAALALVTMNVESDVQVLGYTSGLGYGRGLVAGSDDVTPLDTVLKRTMRIDEATAAIANLPFGGTDCSLPFKWARRNKKVFDGVISYTDSETWAGGTHMSQELRAYRGEIGVPTRSIVVGLTATGMSVNDPKDPYGLDVVGFDANGPSICSQFIAGQI